MFRTIFYLCLLCTPLTSYAQTKAIDQFYDQFQDNKDISRVELKGGILNLVAKFTNNSDTEELVRKVTKLRVLDMKQGNLVSRPALNRLVKAVKKDRYEDLLQIRDEGDDIHILIRETEGAVTDILVLIYGADDFTMLSLEGKMRFKDIQHLNIEFEGADHLEKVPARNGSEPAPDRA